jgi:GDP-D-mannose 3', 5'-epimerase
MAERGYGWEKLDFRNVLPGILARARHENGHRPLPQRLWPARHLGRRPRKSPAALCRKVIEAMDTGKKDIMIWGDGQPDAQLHVY